jgi:hypothetical protein
METATLRAQLDQQIEALSEQLRIAVADADSLRQQAATLHTTLQAILSSTSWRLFGPFRKAADRYPRLARLAVRPLKVIWWTATLQIGHRFVLWRRYRVAGRR